MGVKDLWQLLSPVCERKSLWELQDKVVAIDLSGWVCDSQNIVEHSSQPNMHLRNLFFRTSCLLLLGARPVFVLEGDAPDLKLNVMSQRNATRGLTQASKTSGKRTRYKGIQKKCQEMLQSMGVHCLQSSGEAEALCALLNEKGIVDGCISQDSDCFLYGGQVVYRNFTISPSAGAGGGPGFSIDKYRMEQVEELLGLTRTKLIGLSLLCGCDYNQGGVSGVGKETAVKFLASLKDSEVFPRFSQWRTDQIYEQLEKERTHGVCERCCHLGKTKAHDKSGCGLCGTIKSCHLNNDPDVQTNRELKEKKMVIMELNIRKKALQDENFPSQDVIQEFSSTKKVPKNIPLEWTQPNLLSFIKLAEMHLKWDKCYSVEKFLPLLTRWLTLQKKTTAKSPIYPEAIIKTRVLKGVPSYEVKWADREGLFETLVSDENPSICLTIEPRDVFENAFPELVLEFHEKDRAQKAAKKGKSKTSKETKGAKAPKIPHVCINCGKNLPSKKQKCMCQFVTLEQPKEEKTPSPSTLDDLLDSLSLTSVGPLKESEPLKVISKSSRLQENCKKLKMLLGDDTLDGAKHTVVEDEEEHDGLDFPDGSSQTVEENAKFSFENLLQNEPWTVDDFAEEDSDLSDIVQTITGKCTYVCEPGSILEACIPSSQKIGIKRFDDTINSPNPTQQLSDDIPYTPLIDRVQEQAGTRNKCTGSVLSLKLRRFSESFDAFCMGENATSSPVSRHTETSTSSGSGGAFDVTFSLGITNLMENSK